jgi:hypothetical protein
LANNKQIFFMEIAVHPRLVERKWRSNSDRGFWGVILITDVMEAVDEKANSADSDCPF